MTDQGQTSGGHADGVSLSARVASGTAWIFAARTVMRLFGFLNTIIVARLLAPEDFGLVAVGVTTMQLLQGVSEIGVSQAMVRFRDADKNDVDTLFTLSLARGLFIAVALLAAAPFAAQFFGDPRFFWVFAGVALFPFFTGFKNPRFYEFERDLNFSKEFILLVVNKAAGVIVSITIAVIFRTYWAIILGLATNAAVELFLSYWMRPYRPRVTLASFRKVMGFSGWVTGLGLMAALNNKLDALIIARVLGTNSAGNYYVGLQLAELPTSELAYPISRAIYPGLSSLQGSPERMRLAFLRGVEALAAIAVPVGIGFAFVAQDLISLLLGEKWVGAVPVIQILTPAFALQTIFLATQYYAMSAGLVRLVVYREFIFFFIRTPLFIWATIAHGLVGALLAIAASGVIHTALNIGLYVRIGGDAFWRPLWRARRSLISALAMAAYFFILRPAIPAIAESPIFLRVSIDVALGAVIYTGAHLALWRLDGKPEGVERAIMAIVGGAARRIGIRA